jgi:hypothetical protein
MLLRMGSALGADKGSKVTPIYKMQSIASRNSFSGMPKTREQNASDDVLVPRSHRPPFTTAPLADSQRSSDRLLFITSARADSQRRWLPPSIFRDAM